MKVTARKSPALAAALLTLLAAAPAASAATDVLKLKVPRCTKASTASVSLTATPTPTSLVFAMGAFLNAPPGRPGATPIAQKIYVTISATPATLPLGIARTLTFRVPVGKKIYATAGFGTGSSGSSVNAVSNGVRKCPKPRFTG